MFLLLFSLSSVRAQYIQDGNKIVGFGSTGLSGQGKSVSISSDGTRAIVGGNSDNGGAGAVWFYEKIAGIWTDASPKLVGTGSAGNAGQGTSVSISGNGNYAIVGGPNDNGYKGAVWFFERTVSGTWFQTGTKKVGMGAVGNSQQGFSVSMNYDGTIAIVGAPQDYLIAIEGAFWTFERTGSSWNQFGNKVQGVSIDVEAELGYSVSISADGNTAIVGAPITDEVSGSAHIYTRSIIGWTKVAGLHTGCPDEYIYFGSSVAISSDANTVIVGAPGYNCNTGPEIGASFVYVKNGSSWSVGYEAKLVGTPAGGMMQGSALSISGDGNIAMIGGSFDGAFIFKRSGGIWSQEGSKLLGSGAVGSSSQGTSVSLSANGCKAIMGGPGDDAGMGAAWIFTSCELPADTSCLSIISDTTYCDSTGTYIYEFQIHNNSPTKSIEQLEITVDSPQPPDYVVTVPSTLNFSTPIPPHGNSAAQKVKLIGPGAVAYTEVCYTLSAHFVNDDCPWCCYIENCIKLPICSCAEVIQDSIYCEDGDYFYNFTLQNGTQYDVTKIQITSPGTLPITFIPQIIHFGTPILPGQMFPNLTARMLGAAAGLTIPVKIKLFSDDFECCYLEFDQLIPECDTTYCDTAIICARTLCPDEQLTVCLARSVFPYDILFTATAVPDANGCARYEFPGAVIDESYYLVVKSLNSLETWSAAPQVVNGLNCLEYDFTADSSQAYGNNMMNINGVWYLLSGDVNQDGFIDMTDLLAVYNGAAVFGTGITDLNCDGITDLNDILIVQNNYLNFAKKMRPY